MSLDTLQRRSTNVPACRFVRLRDSEADLRADTQVAPAMTVPAGLDKRIALLCSRLGALRLSVNASRTLLFSINESSHVHTSRPPEGRVQLTVP